MAWRSEPQQAVSGDDPFERAERRVGALVADPGWPARTPAARADALGDEGLVLPDGSRWLFGAWARWYRWLPADPSWHLCPPPVTPATRRSAVVQPSTPPPHVLSSGADFAGAPLRPLPFIRRDFDKELTATVRSHVEAAAALPSADYPHWWPAFAPSASSATVATWAVMLWCAGAPVFDPRFDKGLLALWSPYLATPLPVGEGPRWLTPPTLESLVGLYTERIRAHRPDAASVLLRTMWSVAGALRSDSRFRARADALVACLNPALADPAADAGAAQSGGDTAVAGLWLTRVPPTLAAAVRSETAPGDHLRHAGYDLVGALAALCAPAEPQPVAAALMAADLSLVRRGLLDQVLPWLEPETRTTVRAVLDQPAHPLRANWPVDGRLPDRLRAGLNGRGATQLAAMYAFDLAWCRIVGIPARPRGFPAAAALAAELLAAPPSGGWVRPEAAAPQQDQFLRSETAPGRPGEGGGESAQGADAAPGSPDFGRTKMAPDFDPAVGTPDFGRTKRAPAPDRAGGVPGFGVTMRSPDFERPDAGAPMPPGGAGGAGRSGGPVTPGGAGGAGGPGGADDPGGSGAGGSGGAAFGARDEDLPYQPPSGTGEVRWTPEYTGLGFARPGTAEQSGGPGQPERPGPEGERTAQDPPEEPSVRPSTQVMSQALVGGLLELAQGERSRSKRVPVPTPGDAGEQPVVRVRGVGFVRRAGDDGDVQRLLAALIGDLAWARPGTGTGEGPLPPEARVTLVDGVAGDDPEAPGTLVDVPAPEAAGTTVDTVGGPNVLVVGDPHSGQYRFARIVAAALAAEGVGDGTLREVDADRLLGAPAAGLRAVFDPGTGPVLLAVRFDAIIGEAADPATAAAAIAAVRQGTPRSLLIACCTERGHRRLQSEHPDLLTGFHVLRLPELSGLPARLALLNVLTGERGLAVDAAAFGGVQRDFGRLRGVGARLVAGYLDQAEARARARTGVPRPNTPNTSPNTANTGPSTSPSTASAPTPAAPGPAAGDMATIIDADVPKSTDPPTTIIDADVAKQLDAPTTIIDADVAASVDAATAPAGEAATALDQDASPPSGHGAEPTMVEDATDELSPPTTRDRDRSAPRQRPLVLVAADFAGLAEAMEPVARVRARAADLTARLDALVGLAAVKTAVARLRGRPENLVLAGRPGTGKSTVAEIVAGLYAADGVLEQGQLVGCRPVHMAGRTGFDTEERVYALAERAHGGVLLIDEAHRLAERPDVVAVLVEVMTEARGRFVVFCAGSDPSFEPWLLDNPEFLGHFGETLHFAELTDRELLALFQEQAERDLYSLDEELRLELMTRFGALRLDPSFAFGRAVRELFEQTVARQAERLRQGRGSMAAATRLGTRDLPESPLRQVYGEFRRP